MSRIGRKGLAVAAAIVVVAGGFGAVAISRLTTPATRCQAIAAHADWSVARRWDEALLDAIRRALPNPPVHARNLYHTSVAMWDAWAAYDTTASGYLFKEKLSAADVPAARNEAISYAAYRVLSARFIKAVGADRSLSEFDDLMDALCLPIAKGVLEYGKTDGSNEANGYADPSYTPVNPPLVVGKPGITLVDPNRWQP